MTEDRNLAQSAFLLLAVDDARGRQGPCTAVTCSVYLMSPEMLPLYSCTPLAVTVTSYCLLSLQLHQAKTLSLLHMLMIQDGLLLTKWSWLLPWSVHSRQEYSFLLTSMGIVV